MIADLPIEVSIDEIRELGLERANENFAETIRQHAGRAFERLFEQRGGYIQSCCRKAAWLENRFVDGVTPGCDCELLRFG